MRRKDVFGEFSNLSATAVACGSPDGADAGGQIGSDRTSLRCRTPIAPYESPVDVFSPFAPPAFSIPTALATRTARLAGAVIDGMLNILTMLPLLVGIVQNRTKLPGSVSDLPWLGTSGCVTIILLLGLTAAQAVLIARRGQSIGKVVVRTRIERTDGRPVGFVRGVVLRSCIFMALRWLPLPEFVTKGVFLCDALFIFRKDHRCLHDWIADTRVVQMFR